jgi:dolichyl-diphosphooligosaccharide--protein glycosyltransferase
MKKDTNEAAKTETKDGKDGKSKTKAKEDSKGKAKKHRKAAEGSWWKPQLQEYEAEERQGGAMQLKRIVKGGLATLVPEESYEAYHEARVAYDHNPQTIMARALFSLAVVFYCWQMSGIVPRTAMFVKHCDRVARSLSNPQVAYMVQGRDGQPLLIDDYLQGYKWIDANTPKDSRVMAWWDYGYQITGIGKRTSIADGNTWNHEHIATLGRMLTSPEKKAWNAIRHLADYVLVWAGGGGDDLAKSPHLARIGNSVFPDHCGDDDPKCNKFSFFGDNTPTPMMARSLLYKLVSHEVAAKVKVNQNLFKEVHTTKHGLMRVYKVMNISQESKDWVADPANRECDAPGSWYCVGKYPPALDKLIALRRNFAQLEDFNKAGSGKSAYTKLIEKELSGKGGKDEI